MLDKLIDFALESVERFYFFSMVREYERGLVLRFGRFHRLLEPGFHWIWPVIEDAVSDGVVTRTTHMKSQPLETADGKTVQVAGIMRWRISAIRKAALEVEGVDDAIRDIGYLVIADAVKRSTYEEVRKANFSDVLTSSARKRGWRYGIEVEEMGLFAVSSTTTLVLVNPST